jgi:hypothetical protein
LSPQAKKKKKRKEKNLGYWGWLEHPKGMGWCDHPQTDRGATLDFLLFYLFI